MNQRQKNKFHKAIKDLTELLQELNAGCENWELRYSNPDGTFQLRKKMLWWYRKHAGKGIWWYLLSMVLYGGLNNDNSRTSKKNKSKSKT